MHLSILLLSGCLPRLLASAYATPANPAHSLATTAPNPGAETRAESPTWQSQIAGNTYGGSAFSDLNYVTARGHPRISEIYMSDCSPGSHLIMLGFGYRDLKSPIDTIQRIFHGTRAGLPKTFMLHKDEFINQVDITTWNQKKGRHHRMRVGWVKFTTQTGRVFECGSNYGTDPVVTLTNFGQPLLYMTGTSGDAVDSLAGYFVSDSIY